MTNTERQLDGTICGHQHIGHEGCVDDIAHVWWESQQPDHYGIRHRQFRRALEAMIEAAYARGHAAGVRKGRESMLRELYAHVLRSRPLEASELETLIDAILTPVPEGETDA